MPQWAGSAGTSCLLRSARRQGVRLAGRPQVLDERGLYNGGMEHTTLSPAVQPVLASVPLRHRAVPCPDRYQKRTSHGMILGENGEKMSKVARQRDQPRRLHRRYRGGRDRGCTKFHGAFDQAIPWSTNGARRCRRFLDRVMAAEGYHQGRRGLPEGLSYP